MNNQVRYAAAINEALVSIFDEENENYYLSLDETDLTDFFTALVKASGILFNNLTGEDKNGLEFTYLLNQLIVQDIVKKKGGNEE